ncbi:hypothetical protein ACR2XT_24610, partial [Klebsiella pneumoniae]
MDDTNSHQKSGAKKMYGVQRVNLVWLFFILLKYHLLFMYLKYFLINFLSYMFVELNLGGEVQTQLTPLLGYATA